MAEPRIPNGKCGVCIHVERARIELMISGGASHPAIGRKFKLTKDTVYRHWHHHVTEERRAALALGPVSRLALASRVSEESESVLDHFKAARAGLWQVYDSAVTAGDAHGTALLAGRIHENLNSIAKITGVLASSPLVQINNTQQTTNNVLLADPAFASFQARLISVLRAYPEARDAVIREFSRLEAQPQPAADERAAPQLTRDAVTIDA